mgnify:FL=1
MTYTSFVNALSAITVAGVKRQYTAPPSQLSSADLPALHPQLPEHTQDIISLASSTGLFVVTCELAIVVKANSQGDAAANFAECLTLMDALNDALTNNTAALNIDRWSMRQDGVTYGDTAYWTIVARVEASE